MDVSHFLAKAFGIWMTLAAIALLKDPDRILSLGKELTRNSVALYLGGIMALVIGILIVLSHNVWVLGWPVIITLIGWLSLIKGILFLLFPKEARTFADWYMKRLNLRIVSPIYLVLGLFLLWKGFF